MLKQLFSLAELFPIVEHPGTFKNFFREIPRHSNFRQFVVRTSVFLTSTKVLTKNFLMVQAPGFIRGINPKSKIENPQAPAFIRGVNLKSQISNLKSIDSCLMLDN